MKIIEIEELRKMNTKNLLDEIHLLKQALFKIEFELSGGQSKSGHLRPAYRKQIARIKTILEQSQTMEKASEK